MAAPLTRPSIGLERSDDAVVDQPARDPGDIPYASRIILTTVAWLFPLRTISHSAPRSGGLAAAKISISPLLRGYAMGSISMTPLRARRDLTSARTRAMRAGFAEGLPEQNQHVSPLTNRPPVHDTGGHLRAEYARSPRYWLELFRSTSLQHGIQALDRDDAERVSRVVADPRHRVDRISCHQRLGQRRTRERTRAATLLRTASLYGPCATRLSESSSAAPARCRRHPRPQRKDPGQANAERMGG